MKEKIKILYDKDRILICGLYGIDTKKLTGKEISDILWISQSCISKNHNRILNLDIFHVIIYLEI